MIFFCLDDNANLMLYNEAGIYSIRHLDTGQINWGETSSFLVCSSRYLFGFRTLDPIVEKDYSFRENRNLLIAWQQNPTKLVFKMEFKPIKDEKIRKIHERKLIKKTNKKLSLNKDIFIRLYYILADYKGFRYPNIAVWWTAYNQNLVGSNQAKMGETKFRELLFS